MNMKGFKGFQKGHIINKGKIYSAKRRKNISLSRLGYKPTEETLRKLSLSHLGHKQSEETKFKISKATSGKSKPWLLGRKPGNAGRKSPKTSGARNPRWKGGVTPMNHKIRTSLEYKLFRDAVFTRDGYICQKYGVRGGELHPHHILNFSQYPALRFVIDNGITLSEKAHKEFHKKYGTKNNTREQLLEFLN